MLFSEIIVVLPRKYGKIVTDNDYRKLYFGDRYMRGSKKNILFLAGLLFAFLTVRPVWAQAEESEVKGRVLFISSYSYAWDAVRIQIEGIRAKMDPAVVLDYEFMDTKRVTGEEAEQLFCDGLAYRMSQVEPYDAVILGDDAALLFAVKYREELFEGIPLIFEGVNDVELAVELAKDPLITGVVEQLSLEKNIDFGRQLFPNAGKVVAILDESITGNANRESFYACAEKYPDMEFCEINASALSSEELSRQIGEVGQDSIFIYIIMTEDASGKLYSDREAIKMIVDHAKVPAMRMVEASVGEGLLGGNMVSMYKSGEIVADIAMQLIQGADCGNIAVAESPNVYCVDEQVMEKFGLDMSVLPEGTQIVNHQPDFWERNREVLLPGSILVGAMLIITLWVTFDNLRRRRLLAELEEARGIMESASLHDFLTGLPNRSKFMKDLETAVNGKVPCTILMLDIDDFKHINDTYGHTAGDEALKQLADRLKAMHSNILMSYRFAGDEFIMLLKSNQSNMIEKTAYQSRQLFTKPFRLAGEDRKVCGSIGVATYPSDADDIEQLIVCADDAMYQVKKSGKNNFAYYSQIGKQAQ